MKGNGISSIVNQEKAIDTLTVIIPDWWFVICWLVGMIIFQLRQSIDSTVEDVNVISNKKIKIRSLSR